AQRIRFDGAGSLVYSVASAESCRSPEDRWRTTREGRLLSPEEASAFLLLEPEQGIEQGIPGLQYTFCYDAQEGYGISDGDLAGFAVLPAKDLADDRLDRLSVLLMKGRSAE